MDKTSMTHLKGNVKRFCPQNTQKDTEKGKLRNGEAGNLRKRKDCKNLQSCKN
jgi:hypothetical protein